MTDLLLSLGLVIGGAALSLWLTRWYLRRPTPVSETRLEQWRRLIDEKDDDDPGARSSRR